MKYLIEEVKVNKKDHLDLLLLADEQEDMIDRYLDKGRMFALIDGDVKCVAVVVKLSENECELKNIATNIKDQGKGYARYMIEYLFDEFLREYEIMYVGTGDVPWMLRFYEGCGFVESHRVRNFFTDNYIEPMIEDGVQLRDMVYLCVHAGNDGMKGDNELLKNLDKLHTTELGVVRIKRNLDLDTGDVVEWCKSKIINADSITRKGKNWYANIGDATITVNAHSYTIITAHRNKKDNSQVSGS